jgi:hypothetical protein
MMTVTMPHTPNMCPALPSQPCTMSSAGNASPLVQIGVRVPPPPRAGRGGYTRGSTPLCSVHDESNIWSADSQAAADTLPMWACAEVRLEQ